MVLKKSYFSIIIIIVVISFSFYNSLENDFVNWDDDILVINNNDIKSFKTENIKTFFSNYYVGHYHPFTMMSLAVDYKLGELSPKTYHIHNLLLHILSSILLFFIFYFIFKRNDISLLLVILFAVHPLKVESVSWIAERKDVLFSLYYLGAILSYLHYANNKSIKCLVFSFILFVCSLLSKTSAVTLPVVLILIDYYYKRRILWKSIIEKAPFLILSLIFGVLTISVLKNVDAIYDISEKYSVFERFFMPFYALCFYLLKFIIPLDLSASYFFPGKINEHLPIIYYVSPLIILSLTFVIYKIKILKREIIFGTLFFIVTIFLFLQVIPSGRVIVADRYTYIPFIGLLFIIGQFYVYYLKKKSKLKKTNIFTYIILILICVFIFLTRERNNVWSNGETLFTDIIENYPNNEVAYINRGIAKYYGFTENNKTNFLSAIKDFNKALSIDNLNEKAFFNRGNCFYNINEIPKALNDFNKVLKINPVHARGLNNRGLVYSSLKEDQKALNDYNSAIQINSDYSDAYLNRGIIYYNLNNIKFACNDWLKAKEFGNKRANDFLLNYCK